MAFRVVALIAAYNEEDVISQVLEDLISQGVETYLLDHGSTDATVAEAAQFLGKGLLRIEHFPEESGFSAETATQFSWREILLRKQQLSSQLDADWFLHSDADELRETPWDGVGLRDGLARVDAVGYNAVDFLALDFPPLDNAFHRGDDLRRHFPRFRPAAAYDSLRINAWKRVENGVADLVQSGGHEAAFPGRRVFPMRFLLRHYPVRSQSHGERKIFRERLPRYLADERSIGWHKQYDQMVPTTSFVADPATLEEFDSATVRARLLAENRELEAAKAKIVEAELVAADLAWFRNEWPARERELVEASRERDELARSLEEQQRRLAGLQGGIEAWRRQAVGLERQAEKIERSFRSSLSWRLTAPLRTILRLVRGY